MMRAKIWGMLLLAGSLYAAPSMAQQRSEDEAGDVSELEKDVTGPLRDRIPPITGYRLLMGKRFEFTPTIGVSFRDPFFLKLGLGVQLTYHFTNSLGLSLDAFYAIPFIASWAQICIPQGTPNEKPGCRTATWAELSKEVTNGNTKTKLNNAPGLLHFWAHLNLHWTPIYGKISALSEGAVNFNFYGFLGPSVVMYGGANTVMAGGNIGIGMRFLINRWLAVRLQVRDIIYPEVVARQVAGSETVNSTYVRNQLLVELGFSMFFPTTFEGQR